MPDPKDLKIPVFEVVSAAPAGGGERPLLARGDTAGRAVKMVETSVRALKDSMDEFLAGVSEVFANAEAQLGQLALDTVELQCQISGSGKVGFAGTGVDLSGGSSLKVVLKRKA